MNKNKYLSYQEAKAFIQPLGINGVKGWIEYAKSGQKPDNIPYSVYEVYKNKGWISLRDFLGTEKVSKERAYINYDEAKIFVHALKIEGHKEWIAYTKSGQKPDNIPIHAYRTYKGKGWISWGDFLGTGRINNKDRVYLSYDEAKAFVQTLRIKGHQGWREYAKSGQKPDNIPTDAYKTYQGKGWTSWGDFLGAGRINNKDRVYLTYDEAKAFIKPLRINGVKGWIEYAKSGQKPDNIPHAVHTVYSNKGWTSWGDFLGAGRVYLTYDEAKAFVQTLRIKGHQGWIAYTKSGQKPDNIPHAVNAVYKNKGWTSWGDFLGTGKAAKQKRFFHLSQSEGIMKI
jgi:hypothetical protein